MVQSLLASRGMEGMKAADMKRPAKKRLFAGRWTIFKIVGKGFPVGTVLAE